ncbi:hypothetical protein B0T16DRAFT_416538 [Cercophora newfieldiana]|uniref:Uncharacterized protein n=1 Tax=Cercophora newfieldiana TaxID=92897 RepID=A0AA39Y0H2_9PEZI|nr:hypothetical protein B0T16DRAFT_416538 [Cercophora newfieldiana]
MKITAKPVPTSAPGLLRRQDAAVCGRDGTSLVSCLPSSTCALRVNSVDGKDHAGCHSAGDVIPTSCTDLSTACTSCLTTEGLLTCLGNMYCATRFWYPEVTGEFEKPLATSYWCNKGTFLQLTGTYLPSSDGVWNSAPATDPHLRQTTAGQQPSNPTSGVPKATDGSNSGGSSGQGTNENSPSSSTSASSPLSTGAIAGIAVGGALVVIIAIVAFVFLRRRKKSTESTPPTEMTRPSPSRDQALLDRGVTPSASHPYPVEKEGDDGFTQQFPPAQDHRQYLSQTSSGLSDTGEQSDTLGGLPDMDDMRRLRTVGGIRGAPSVMTDMSETLTLGGDGEVDDIHAIGHER